MQEAPPPSADAAAILKTAIAARDWHDIDPSLLTKARAVPSMLSEDETRLYHWLGRRAQGLGACVDLGAFAGGSAARLLSGLAVSGRPFHLHAYDRFTAREVTRRNHLYPAGVPVTEDDDILPLVRRFLAPWPDGVTLHRGDILDARWESGPVEIIAVDAAKTPELADHIAETFFPALIPGVSVVIQQDFLHAVQPWIAVQMAALRPFFAPAGQVSHDCVVFLNTAPVTPDAITRSRTAGLTDRELVDALRQAADGFAADGLPRPRFRAMIDKVRANPGVRISWKMRN